MMTLSKGLEQAIFDDAAYQRRNPDVARAVASKEIASGWQHYDNYGRNEGRKAFEFDAEFYLRAYPVSIQEIESGLAESPLEHYAKFGLGRGYLPFFKAVRPDDAAAIKSPFGGFWIDQPNVRDLIRGRQELGRIDARQAALLQKLSDDGYVVLESAIPEELIERAERDLDKAYSGGFKNLILHCAQVGEQACAWVPKMNAFPAKALDLHWFSKATRDLVFADAITEFLGLVFENRLFASQTLGFLRGSAQEAHQDSAYVAYTIPRQFCATWIALEDVTIGAGELFYYVGSHKAFREFVYGGKYKSVTEAERNGAKEHLKREIQDHVVSLEERARIFGLKKEVFAAKRGDVLVWHADLAHGGNPVSRDITRKSVVTHYCPRHAAPLFAEHGRTTVLDHNGHLFTTSAYVGTPAED